MKTEAKSTKREFLRLVQSGEIVAALRMIDNAEQPLRDKLIRALASKEPHRSYWIESAIRNCDRVAASWLAGKFGVVTEEFPPDVEWGPRDANGVRRGKQWNRRRTEYTSYKDPTYWRNEEQDADPLFFDMGTYAAQILTKHHRPRLRAARSRVADAIRQYGLEVLRSGDRAKAAEMAGQLEHCTSRIAKAFSTVKAGLLPLANVLADVLALANEEPRPVGNSMAGYGDGRDPGRPAAVAG